MPNNWPEVRVEDIHADKKGAIAIGPFGSRMKSDCYVDSGIPVIRGTNLGESPKFKNDFVYISAEKADSLGSCNVFKDDLVFPHRGSIGEVGIISDDKRYVISSSLMKLTCDESKVNPKFLYYFFKSLKGKHELLKNASQVGTPGIGQPLTSLKSIQFRNPPLSIQNKIIYHIEGLNNKIELNRQTNQTLEQMAQTLFKSWFVDFDPVFDNLLAKANYQLDNLPADFPEELHPKAVTRLAALNARIPSQEHENERLGSGHESDNAPLPHPNFPSEFEFNEQLGWVPLGWEVKTIDGLCNINPQSWTKKNAPESVKYIDLANAKNGAVGEVVEYIFEDAPSRARRMLQPHDTIIGVVRPANRSFAYINEDGLTGSTGFAVVRAKKEIYRAFSYLSLTNDDCIQEFTRIADGAAYPAIKPEDVAKTNCVFSNDIILEKFEYIVGQLMKKIAANEKQIKSLTKLRDTLLPKLISGELQIPDLEPSSHALRGNV